MEELIYWGIIFLFYLFSAYRSRQKKVKSEDFQVPEVKPDPVPKTSTPDFNIFEFLDDAVENSAVEMDNFVNEKPSSLVNKKLSIQKGILKNKNFSLETFVLIGAPCSFHFGRSSSSAFVSKTFPLKI